MSDQASGGERVERPAWMSDEDALRRELTDQQMATALASASAAISDFEKSSLSRHYLRKRVVEELRRLGVEPVGPVENPTALRRIDSSSSSLSHPFLVLSHLQSAVASLSSAHHAAGEDEDGQSGLNGSVRDLIYGLNTAVESLIQMVDEGRFSAPLHPTPEATDGEQHDDLTGGSDAGR